MNKLLGTLVFIFFAASAQAQTTLTLTGLTVQFDTTLPPTASVLADTSAYAQLALPLVAAHGDVPGYDRYVEDWTDLYLAPRPGYIIDSLRFSANLSGWWHADAPPPGATNILEAVAGNRARTGLYVMADNATDTVVNLTGDHAVDLQLLNLHADGPIPLSVFDLLAIQDFSGHYEIDGESYRLNATASIALTNPVVTIYLSPPPVPEPQTWAMLSAGLILLRTRRRCR